MVLMEEISEAPTSNTISIGAESIVVWLGDKISSLCGIRITQGERQKLSGIVQDRMARLSLNDPMVYFQLVESQSAEGRAEWQELLTFFMNGETFFFRDNGQFTLLKKHILPTLIHRRKTSRSLRILSAGCSTGEEAYSLAILVDQLLPDRQNWAIDILGLDINFRSIQYAQQGIYGPWAFRKVDAELQQGYFQQRGSQWVLRESIRKMVMFRTANIFSDTLSSSALGIDDFDLIICRNVLLYFHADAIGHVVNKMLEVLTSDGYFLTGHGELPAQTLGDLHTTIFPDSVIYQRFQTMAAMSHKDSL